MKVEIYKRSIMYIEIKYKKKLKIPHCRNISKFQ